MLFLASGSASRKALLDAVGISYTEIAHQADEMALDWNQPLEQLVKALAEYKMDHIVLPNNLKECSSIFVLTADTLSIDNEGIIHGKPKDRNDARIKIQKLREGSTISTGFCLDRLSFKNGNWVREKRIVKAVCADCIFDVPDLCIDRYLDATPALEVCGAITIDGYGQQFLKAVYGSYTTIIGLPLFEVRQALEELDFFN